MRNSLRGRLIGLPTAQELARLMGVPVLSPAELTRGESEVVARLGFDQETPLWFYLLKEAEIRAGGLHLGAMAAGWSARCCSACSRVTVRTTTIRFRRTVAAARPPARHCVYLEVGAGSPAHRSERQWSTKTAPIRARPAVR